MPSLTLQINFIFVFLVFYKIIGCRPLAMDLRAASGRDARIPCGHTDPLLDDLTTYVTWSKGGKFLYRYPPKDLEIRFGSHDQILGTSCNTEFCPNDSGLPLRRVTDRDGGIYICRLNYKNVSTGEVVVNLTIVEPTEAPRIYDERGDRVWLGFVGPYSLGSTVTLICQVATGNTRTDLYWLRNGQKVKYAPPPQSGIMQVVIHLYNISRSDLNLIYQCVTQNSDVSKPLVTNAVIKMFTPPLSVEMRAGSSKVNSTIYLEIGQPRVVDCIVTGCVPPPTVAWYAGTRLLRANIHKETHDGNFTISTLTLTPDAQHDGKELYCRVHNSYIAKDFGAKATLIVGYRPVCKSRQIKIGAVTKEVESVTCIVEAQPPPKEFIWTFADNLSMRSDFSKVTGFENQYIANLTWLPRADDLGLLICRASNMFGNQTVPCMFNISVGGVPEVPNCDVRRTYPDSLRVRCIKGWDGGRPQMIHLEIFAEDGSSVQNLTDVDGTFFLPELRFQSRELRFQNLSAVIYSSNVRGKSKEWTTLLESLHPIVDAKSSFFPSAWAPYVESSIVITAVLSTVAVAILFIKIMKSSRVKNTAPVPDGIFRREPDFFREERLLSLPINSLDRPGAHTNEYTVPSPPPACPVLFDDNPRCSPDTSTSLQTYYV